MSNLSSMTIKYNTKKKVFTRSVLVLAVVYVLYKNIHPSMLLYGSKHKGSHCTFCVFVSETLIKKLPNYDRSLNEVYKAYSMNYGEKLCIQQKDRKLKSCPRGLLFVVAAQGLIFSRINSKSKRVKRDT